MPRRSPATPPLEYRAVPFGDAQFDASGNGSLAGWASIFNAVDTFGDTLQKGAYARTIPDFLQRGAILWAHRMDAFPIGYPTRVEERDQGLWLEAAFHGDEQAQRARRIVQERLAAGKSLGLSIGFITRKSHATKAGRRQVDDLDLHEVSLVPSPSNRESLVAEVRSDPPDPPDEPDEDAPDPETPIPPEELETRALPTAHGCRLREPAAFEPDSFRALVRRHEGRAYQAIVGRLKGESTLTDQALRYDRNAWTAALAQAHCDEFEDAEFTAATGQAAAAEDTYAQVWSEEQAAVLTALEAAEATLGRLYLRALAQADLERKQGALLGAEPRAILRAILETRSAINARFALLDDLIAATAPAPHWDARLALRAVELRMLGVPVRGGFHENGD